MLDAPPEDSAPSAALRPGGYRGLLGRSPVRWQAFTGLLAQVTQGASAIGIILVIRYHTGSLALAGGTVGALSIAAGISRPLQGRIIDRRGSRGVMAVCGIAHAAALVGIVGLSSVHAPGASLLALGALAGLSLPPVSTTMRVEWGKLVPCDDRTAAYSLVFLTQELAILTGPLILAAIIAAASASAALVVIAALTAVGGLGFAASMGGRSRDPEHTPATRIRALVLRNRAMQLVLTIAFLLGGLIGGIDVAVPALATEHRTPAAAGLLIAGLSVGGLLGGVVYGARRWGPHLARRLCLLLGWLTAAIGVTVAAHSLLAAGLLLFLAGLALNPALTTFSLLVDRHVPARVAAEGFGWLSTGLAGGTGAASAIAAVVVQQHHDAKAGFLVAAIAGAGAVLVSLLGARLLGGGPAPRPEPTFADRPRSDR